MRLLHPNVPNCYVEVADKDKEQINAHLEAGWQKESSKRTSAKAAKAVNETSSVTKTEGD